MAVRKRTVQLPRRLATKEEGVELLVAWRLEPLIATCAKPAVACGVVHRAQHVRRQQRRGNAVLDCCVIEAAHVKGSVMRDDAHVCCQRGSDQRKELSNLRLGGYAVTCQLLQADAMRLECAPINPLACRKLQPEAIVGDKRLAIAIGENPAQVEYAAYK